MTRTLRFILAALLTAGFLATHAQAQTAQTALKKRFVFGANAASGEVAVAADAQYSAARGYGFEGGDAASATTFAPAVAGPRAGQSALAPAQPLYFSVDVPEGAYRVTVTLGGTDQASDTTLRGELRRLFVQNARTAARQTLQQQFTVHVRRPGIPAGPGRAEGQVLLRGAREAVTEGWNWDSRLTLEINGSRPVVQALDIEAVRTPVLFLLGDSTVADQPEEPYASWGQMLPRFFGPTLAVASLAQSGESYRDSLTRRRLDKILSLAQPGDTVLMQYGHNDQKQLRDGSGSVATYQEELRQHIRAFKAANVQAVVVTSVERRFFNAQGELQRTLTDYVNAAREVAAEMQVPLLDLNSASRTLYLALGPQVAPQAFARQADGKIDATHHNNYGAWLLAGLVAQGLRDLSIPAAAHLRADAPRVLADKPPNADALGIRASPNYTKQRPPGDGDNAAAVQAASYTPGFSADRLARLDAAVDDEIKRGRLAGAVTLVMRDGRVAHQRAQGRADIENRVAMRPDTMFRIASMSKAVTTVAAMLLYEEGRFLLRDPVARYLPEFADVRVAVMNSGTSSDAPAGQPKLEKPKRAMTVRDLLQHTAGLTYGAGPAAAEWKAAGFSDWYLMDRDETLAQWTARLARLPLQGHPGETFQYGYATDVLGRLVEVWSGMSLERFVAERITTPLGMPDTHFFMPPEKAARLAHVYGLEKGALALKETPANSDFLRGPRKLASGGAGMVSTAGDYARFLQMLLNGGVLEGVRLLSPATVALLHRDHLGSRYMGDGEGAGFGFWVQTSPGTRSELGSEGAYGWGSAYSPQYLVDPRQRMLVVFMTQLRPAGDSTINQRVKVLARQALLE